LPHLTNVNYYELNKQIDPPPYKLFSSENAAEVLKMVARNEVNGRAILQFADLNPIAEGE
jgi:hypothetical protein